MPRHQKSNKGEDPPPIEIPAALRCKMYEAIKDPMKRAELLQAWYGTMQLIYMYEGRRAVDDWVEKELESLEDIIFEAAKAKGQEKIAFYSKVTAPALPFVLSIVMAVIHHF
ncbi:hypothetical protein LB523_05405 [Mesorhizobium sp. ESP-6-4]|uniref:hypothetical protein n=1 Tax=Mesorhizobium sp. ESP-6-4 TaxID=2876624 RepID=UPI001CCB1011|nr:hypothetical protein [Mesorhizobium sp. ESP-6-4]MBZ9658473.1 hypothetical protein [Mesorhizobium sp. ESP-6-4]